MSIWLRKHRGSTRRVTPRLAPARRRSLAHKRPYPFSRGRRQADLRRLGRLCRRFKNLRPSDRRAARIPPYLPERKCVFIEDDGARSWWLATASASRRLQNQVSGARWTGPPPANRPHSAGTRVTVAVQEGATLAALALTVPAAILDEPLSHASMSVRRLQCPVRCPPNRP